MSKKVEGDLPPLILIEDLGMMFPTENSKHRVRYGLYKCGFCETTFKASTYHILSGHTNSCGCYKKQKVKEVNTKHGLGATRLYKIWGKSEIVQWK